MGMTIDKTIDFFNGLECYTPQAKDARDVAISIMRKYQKIEQIVGSKAFHIIPDKPNCVDSEHELRIRYNEICEVLEDGNVD